MKFQAFNFKVKNVTDDSVDVFIDGAIVDAETQEMYQRWFGDETSISFKSFRNNILSQSASIFNIYINSPGGVVTDAMAIHDLIVDLESKGKTVNTIGQGIIASAATYILMASKNSSMSQNSWFMIHNVSGYAWGDVNEVESMAATLRKFNDATRDFYASATGMRKEDIAKMMNAETWLTAQEAKDKGFIKNVKGDASFTNALTKENWQFTNMAVFNAYNASVSGGIPNNNNFIQNQFEEMKKFFQTLSNNIMEKIKGVQKPDEAVENAHENFMNAIGEAVSKPLEAMGETMETEISNAVAEAVKPYMETITSLQTENKTLSDTVNQLKSDITNMKGSQTSGKKEDGPAPIGNFSK